MNDVRLQLIKDHEELEQLLRRLSEGSAAPEAEALLPTWCQFETRLLAHMDAEERHLLPLMETSHPLQTARARTEHARIRRLVSELGVAIELHTARRPAITELIAVLREHAEHEDQLVYQLASQRAPAAVRDRISAALKISARLALVVAARVRPDELPKPQTNRQAQP
jgi:hemerythrin-like domain-containing protein